MLLLRGADPSVTDRDGNDTPLTAALSRGVNEESWETYYILLDAGADINQVYNGSETIAETAIALGRPSKALELVRRGYRHDLERLALAARTINVNEAEVPARDELLAVLQTMLGTD